MKMYRTLRESVIDKLLLLYLIHKYKISGKTKLQKTIFFTEDSLSEKKVKSFNYTFIRYHYGEFSRELESDFIELLKNGLLSEKPRISTTKKAGEILERLETIFRRNSEVIDMLDCIAKYTSSRSLDTVKTMAYTKIIRNEVQVKDIEEGRVLLQKLNDSEAKTKFEINDKWIGTLDILFDKEASNSLSIALRQKANIPFNV